MGGGRTGDYDIVIIKEETGSSIVNSLSKFSYKVVVTALSLSEASIGGGVDLVITGYNLQSSFKSTNVFIGNAVNNFCPIKSVSDTQIVC